MPTPKRDIRINDDDWDAIGKMATAQGMSKTAWLLEQARIAAAAQGVILSGAAAMGNPNIRNVRRKGKAE